MKIKRFHVESWITWIDKNIVDSKKNMLEINKSQLKYAEIKSNATFDWFSKFYHIILPLAFNTITNIFFYKTAYA